MENEKDLIEKFNSASAEDKVNFVQFKDSEKLNNLGYQDGYEKAIKILNGENPERIEQLNPQGPADYISGYIKGIEKAKEEYSNDNTKLR